MDYKLLFDTAVFAGELLMKNGAETYRVEDTMYRILKKSNLMQPAREKECLDIRPWIH